MIIEFHKNEEYIYHDLIELKKKYYKKSWKDLLEMMIFKINKYE